MANRLFKIMSTTFDSFDNTIKTYLAKVFGSLGMEYTHTQIFGVIFDGVKGTEAVLKYATKNKYNKIAEELQAYANELNKELGRFDPEKRHLFQVEVPNRM